MKKKCYLNLKKQLFRNTLSLLWFKISIIFYNCHLKKLSSHKITVNSIFTCNQNNLDYYILGDLDGDVTLIYIEYNNDEISIKTYCKEHISEFPIRACFFVMNGYFVFADGGGFIILVYVDTIFCNGDPTIKVITKIKLSEHWISTFDRYASGYYVFGDKGGNLTVFRMIEANEIPTVDILCTKKVTDYSIKTMYLDENDTFIIADTDGALIIVQMKHENNIKILSSTKITDTFIRNIVKHSNDLYIISDDHGNLMLYRIVEKKDIPVMEIISKSKVSNTWIQ